MAYNLTTFSLVCEEYYPEGGLENMRSMEQYLPNPNQTRQYADGKGKQIRTYELFSRDYRVATLSKMYLAVS